jgi:hypothetical protein
MDATYAYLAGAIDIDGFISIACRISKSQGRPGGSRYFARIGLSDASPIVPELLHSLFPGTLARSHPKQATYTAFHIWAAEGEKAREPLVRLLPHLRLKRRHAELALELTDLIKNQNKGRCSTDPLSVEEEVARLRLYEEVKRLNAVRSRRKHRVEAETTASPRIN